MPDFVLHSFFLVFFAHQFLIVQSVFLQELKLLTNTFFPFHPFHAFCLWLCLGLSRFNPVCVWFGPDVFQVSVDERAKHDQQFHSLSPTAGGYITGTSQLARSENFLFMFQTALMPDLRFQETENKVRH